MDQHKNARSLPASRVLFADRVEKQAWSSAAATQKQEGWVFADRQSGKTSQS
jgi:hypothetical protein